MMILNKTKHEVVSEFRCAEILRAASKVFARRGFDGATVDQIAETAGLAKGTVYVYFASKRELYLEAVKQGIAELIDKTRRNMEAALGTAEKIKAFIRTRIEFAEEHRDLITIYAAGLGSSAFEREFKGLYFEQLGDLEAVLEQGSREGLIRPVRACAAAFLIYEVTRGLATQRRRGWSHASAEDEVELLFDLVWNGLATSGDPAGREGVACPSC